ncbi:MAG: hypothetical protein WKG07_18715 [Hymenobacter sp.]
MSFPENDLTGYTFFYSTFALLGAAVFFLFERNNVPKRWRVNLTVAGLICLIASVSYFYMQAMYVGQGVSPTPLPLHRLALHGAADVHPVLFAGAPGRRAHRLALAAGIRRGVDDSLRVFWRKHGR